MNDNIVEEIHAIRGRIFEECNNDSDKLAAYYLRLQEESCKSRINQNPPIETNRSEIDAE